MAQYLKKKTFIKVMRGYSPEEVDEYIEYLLAKYDEMARENEDNKRKIALALHKMQELNKRNADSEQSSASNSKTFDDAKAESQRIIDEAVLKAGKIIESAKLEAQNIYNKAAAEADEYVKLQRETAHSIYAEVFAFRDKLFGMYNDHIELIEHIAEEANTYYDNLDETDISDEDIMSFGESEIETELNETAEPDLQQEPEQNMEAESVPEEENSEDDIIPDELLSDISDDDVGYDGYIGDEEYSSDTSSDMAKYLSIVNDEAEMDDDDIDIHIDWAKHKAPAQESKDSSNFNESLSDNESAAVNNSVQNNDKTETEDRHNSDYAYDYDAEADISDDETDRQEQIKMSKMDSLSENEFSDFDDFLENGAKSKEDYSLTDEFDIVFSNKNSAKNVEEIVKQPLVTPEKPSNPKKHRLL